ncbi:hypothetical protein B0H63DRAFT_456253 [Podospora didyma]|uniref:Uncharacterized protein n=1 Tax=Podospora didyma TaxID=330526 RepID=A0AAE0JY96_9PEZI|nr:hypothetical protein B0H63DRAFT_456253 [Podospora didyma]
MPQLYTGVVDVRIVDPCNNSLGAVEGPTCGNANGTFVVNLAIPDDYSHVGAKAQMLNPFLVKVPQAGFSVTSAAAVDLNSISLRALVRNAENLSFPLLEAIICSICIMR